MTEDAREPVDDQDSVPKTYVTGDVYGAMPERAPVSPARAALPWFLAGVAVAVATSAIRWRFFHRDDGYAAWWWGAYLLVPAVWRTAWTRGAEARADTGRRLGAGAIAVVLVGLVIALGSVAILAATSFVFRAPP